MQNENGVKKFVIEYNEQVMPKVKQEAYINRFMIAKIEEHKDEDLKIDYNQLSPLFYEF